MLDLLRSLEWANVGPCCPSCERVKMDGHTPDCRLDRAIRDLASSAIEEVPEPSPLVVGDRVVALTPHGWADATILRIEASGPVLIRTESGVTWLVERERIRRQDQTLGPTVAEMAREIGLYHGTINAPGYAAHEEPAWFADERLIPGQFGALYISRVWGPDWRPLPVWTCRNDRTKGYATDEMAIRTLYREHKAKQADPPEGWYRAPNGLVMPIREAWPTDPSALAAWLYARVVPGQTAVEYRTAAGIVGKSLVARCYAGTDRVAIGIYGGETVLVPGQGSTLLTFTRLLNPDGTVLWEGKPMPTKESK